MTDEQEKKKAKRPPIGSVGDMSKFATIGGGRKKFEGTDVLSPDHLNDETLNLVGDKTLKRQEDEMLSSQDAIAIEQQNALALSSQSTKALGQQDDKELKRQTIYLPKRLALWLKSHAALTEQDMSEIVTKLIEEYQRREEGNK